MILAVVIFYIALGTWGVASLLGASVALAVVIAALVGAVTTFLMATNNS